MKQFKGFVTGMITTALILSLSLGVMAATNMIEIKPINIMVNGEVFKPKDVNGKEVPVFTYEGTTYAPLRALGEAFGQKIGYDAEKNMAVVGDVKAESGETEIGEVEDAITEIKSYEDFKKSFTVKKDPMHEQSYYIATYRGNMTIAQFEQFWVKENEQQIKSYAIQLAKDVKAENNLLDCLVRFMYNGDQMLITPISHVSGEDCWVKTPFN